MIKNIRKENLKIYIPYLMTALHTIFIAVLSQFIFKRNILSGVKELQDFWVSVFCCIIAIIVVFIFYKALFEVIFYKNIAIIKCVKYSAIYFLILFITFLLVYPMQSIGGDIDYFISLAADYKINWDLYYLSSMFYIVPMLLMPAYIAPSLFQILILSLITGYCVYRGKAYFKNWYLLYIPFLLLPIIYYSHFINRPPVYTGVYLLFITILLFDYYERKELSAKKLIFLCMVAGILSRWRYEGIYLLILTPILLAFIYKRKSKIVSYFIFICLLSFLINIPQNLGTVWSDENYNSKRMTPFLYYNLPIMIYSGLEINYNEQEFQDVNKVMDLEKAKEVVEQKGEDILEGLWISWEGGIRENISDIEYDRFVSANIRIITKNIGIFLKGRFLAWNYTAINKIPYKADMLGRKEYITENYYVNEIQKKILPFYTIDNREKELEHRMLYNKIFADEKIEDSSLLQQLWILFKKVQWNLYIPALLGVLELIYTYWKKRWIEFIILIGVVIHTGIVFIMAPSSYFHYYYVMYCMSYYMFFILFLKLRKEKYFGKTVF